MADSLYTKPPERRSLFAAEPDIEGVSSKGTMVGPLAQPAPQAQQPSYGYMDMLRDALSMMLPPPNRIIHPGDTYNPGAPVWDVNKSGNELPPMLPMMGSMGGKGGPGSNPEYYRVNHEYPNGTHDIEKVFISLDNAKKYIEKEHKDYGYHPDDYILTQNGKNIPHGVKSTFTSEEEEANDPFAEGKKTISYAVNNLVDGKIRSAPIQVPEGGGGLHVEWDANKRQLNLHNIDFEKKGTGAFGTYLDHIEQIGKERGINKIRIESIMNDRLIPFLKKRGYTVDPGDPKGHPNAHKDVGRQ
jgi:hypothetical protein